MVEINFLGVFLSPPIKSNFKVKRSWNYKKKRSVLSYIRIFCFKVRHLEAPKPPESEFDQILLMSKSPALSVKGVYRALGSVFLKLKIIREYDAKKRLKIVEGKWVKNQFFKLKNRLSEYKYSLGESLLNQWIIANICWGTNLFAL